MQPEPSAPRRASLGAEMRAAALALGDVLEGQHLDESLHAVTAALPAASRPAVRDMAHAAVRRLGLIRALQAELNHRPPATPVSDLQAVALSGLLDGRRAAATVIDQAVEATRALALDAARAGDVHAPPPEPLARFVNGTLRRFTREHDALLAHALRDPVARWNLPDWWIDTIRAHYGGQADDVLLATHRRAPLTLRINPRTACRVFGLTDPQQAADRAVALLEAAGIGWRRQGPSAVVLERPLPVEAIPGFADGLFTVQDAGAQWSARWLGARDGERVLDACAAPGGKSTHLLQLARCALTALDVDPARLDRLRANLEREKLDGAHVVAGDAAHPHDWWDGRPFDRILVDAPCTASGIVRRHPDIAWHRQRGDPATFAATQRRLVGALWPLLRPGGTLLYVTCSVFPEEGRDVAEALLASLPGAAACPLPELPSDGPFVAGPVVSQSIGGPAPGVAPPAPALPASVQLLPTARGPAEQDGYFHALLSKAT